MPAVQDSDKFKVLIVDDEWPLLELMGDILGEAGYLITAESSPVAALDLIKRQRFDVLVQDVYMPELHGMLFHAKVKLLDRELATRTVFVSGKFSRDELKHDLEQTHRLLPKPFRPLELVQLVQNVQPTEPRGAAIAS